MRLILLLLPAFVAGAAESANQGLRILPAPGAVVIDGSEADWDRSGGILVVDDPAGRDVRSAWLHAMHTPEQLLLLAVWRDPTPLDNPGTVGAAKVQPWAGDCLQLRFITAYEGVGGEELVSHWNCWRDQGGRPAIDAVWGRLMSRRRLADAGEAGARQAFATVPGGYVQELAIPWGLLSADGRRPAADTPLRITVELCWTPSAGGKPVAVKDLFFPGIAPDRQTTFRSPACWAPAWLMPTGRVAPAPLRLSDGTTLPVRMVDGRPSVD